MVIICFIFQAKPLIFWAIMCGSQAWSFSLISTSSWGMGHSGTPEMLKRSCNIVLTEDIQNLCTLNLEMVGECVIHSPTACIYIWIIILFFCPLEPDYFHHILPEFNLSASQIGHDMLKLHKLIRHQFQPHFDKSVLVGPDVTSPAKQSMAFLAE